MKIELSFHECEHEGDLDNYLADIAEAGGEVITHSLNHEAETAEVVVEVDDPAVFREKLNETSSQGFYQ